MKFFLLLAAFVLLNLNAVDYASSLRRQEGEILPKLIHPNLLRNPDFSDSLRFWTGNGDGVFSASSPDSLPAVSMTNHGNGVVLYSDPFRIEPGRTYLLTGVYHTTGAVFGSYSEIALVPDGEEKKFFNQFRQSKVHTPLVRRVMFNCRKGQWRRITLQQKFSAETERVRVVIVVDGNPSQIYWSGFYVGEAGPDNRKNPPNCNDVPCPEEEFARRMAARPNAVTEVRMHGGAPAIFINGKVVPPHIQFGDAFNSQRTRRQSFRKSGVNLQFISLNNVTRRFWIGDRKYNLRAIDEHIRDSIRKNPDGFFVIRIDLTPYKDWGKDHPDTVSRYADGTFTKSRHGFHAPPDYWSPVYREAALHYMTSVIRYIRDKDYFRAVAGIFPSGNEDQQFYYQADKRGVLNDGLAPDSRRTFRRFLEEKYPDDKAFQRAWGRQDITRSSAVPDVKNTRYRSAGNFWDPEKYQSLIDYTQYLNVAQGEFANLLCETARKEAGKPVLTVMWWGRGAALTVYPFYSQTTRILPRNDLNLMGAQAGYYGQRESGSAVFFPWVFDSLRIHGKIAMDEGDYRTWVCGFKNMLHDYRVARFWTLEDYTNAVKREIGKMIGIGGGYWHFALTDGWYDDPGIMEFIARTQKIWEALTAEAPVFTPAEIVVVADENNYSFTTEQVNVWNGPNYHAIRNNQDALLRSGLKYDFYYLRDLMDRKMTGYKIYLFSNIFHLDAEKRAFVEGLKRDGKTLVFLYAPGYLNGGKSMEELTGMQIRQCDNRSKLARFEKQNSPLLRGIGGRMVGLGIDMPGERFEVTDAGVEVLARYGDGKIAGAARSFESWNSVYFGPPSCLTPVFLQNLARTSGVPVYNTPGDMFFHHRDDLLVIHGVEGNVNRLRFPDPVQLEDLYTGEVFCNPDIRLKPGETRLLRVKRRR